MNPLIIVFVLFSLSLIAAVILFAFFKSTAVIRTPRYQAGGAIAGFVIVFAILQLSFTKVSGYATQQQTINDLQAKVVEYDKFTRSHDISGSVDPYSEKTKVAFVVTEADLPVNRRFRLTAPCVDLKKGRSALYIIQEGRSFLYEIFPDDDLSALRISLPQ
jgi:hypothetical protein